MDEGLQEKDNAGVGEGEGDVTVGGEVDGVEGEGAEGMRGVVVKRVLL